MRLSALIKFPTRETDEITRDRFRIRGGIRLHGEIEVNGGKNAALGVLAAALLCDEPVTIENLPLVDDILQMRDLFVEIGAKVTYTGRSMIVDASNVNPYIMPRGWGDRAMRATYYLLGAMLGRCGEGRSPAPGGCKIGNRLMDQHVKGFAALGATFSAEENGMCVKAAKLRGTEIFMDVASVGATINVMLAAVKAEGTTSIVNANKEPHIVDVANFLNAMGASVKGAGTDVIRIKGVSRMHGCVYAIIPDQIETGTLMIAAAATNGDVTIKGAIPTHMEALSAKLLEMGARVEEGVGDDSIRVWSNGNHRHVNVKTLPYPGFPTDLQQPMSALLSTARGVSVVNETIFEMRFNNLTEIAKMGGNFRISDRTAIIEGVPKLHGGDVLAGDLRAGASLIIAGLMAEGETFVSNIHYIERGYENIEKKLRSIGARIDRVPASP